MSKNAVTDASVTAPSGPNGADLEDVGEPRCAVDAVTLGQGFDSRPGQVGRLGHGALRTISNDA